ncbi:MAG: hypothetical protein IKD75_12665 [Prevotella sp.]|nr:hypothetical protein [Prevotella sp.]
MAKSDVLVRMKADVSNYDANIAKARRTLEGFRQDNLTLGGIINQSTKSVVAAAAQYASFAGIIGTVASGMSEAISQGSAMAKEMEGVSMAFERLNQPGLLDNLREATHGTVNDLELMKQAVKFDNFNLSLEQMGTFLAFAQQQAKDTGQDVGYLVDSIVTGLGRKSLPILDNLGLSAEEIRERMKETGDMTKAVADIIQERMDAAGGYVETAADRAAQAQVRLDNAMIELGNTMNSLSGSGAALWTDLKVGAIELLNTAIKPLISAFDALASYINSPTTADEFWNNVASKYDDGSYDDNGRLINKNAIASIPEISVTGTKPITTKKTRVGGTRQKTPEIGDFNKQLKKSLEDTDSLKNEILVPSVWEDFASGIRGTFDTIGEGMENLTEWTEDFDPFTEKMEKMTKAARQQQMAFGMAGQAATSFGTALASLDDPAAKAAGTVISAIANIALGFGQAVAQAGSMGPWAWLAYVAAGAAALATTISTVHSLTGFSHGGIVDGNSYSGDNIPIMANAGELVLTKADQASLVNHLDNAGIAGLGPSKVSGEQIYVVLNRYTRRSGKGELVTW